MNDYNLDDETFLSDDEEHWEPEDLETTEAIKQIEKKLLEEIDFEKISELCEYIKKAIQDILHSCGLYFRIFSRVKSANSIAKKIYYGHYGTVENPRSIQDLLGLRAVLYYYDDMSICREIMENTFQMIGEWSRPRFKVNEFDATKTNGVFRIPMEYFKHYEKKLWSFPIDTTFEIQLRTMFFEGWHEIEHDMRYKSMISDDVFWKDSEELSRILNCILANLELSDWSLVELFNQLSYHHYKAGNWDLMLKSKYRIRMSTEDSLSPEIVELFDKNKSLAKKFYKAKRKTLVKELLKLNHPKITHNLIIKLLNEKTVKDSRITEICNRIDCIKPEETHQKQILTRLESRNLFHLKLFLLHKETRKIETEFHNAVLILYKWMRFKFHSVFEDIPIEPISYEGKLPGYEINLVFQPENYCFSMEFHHIDSHLAGTIWHVFASIHRTANGSLLFQHTTSRDMPRGVSQPSIFSKPSYLSDLSNKIGIIDIVRLGSKAKFVNTLESNEELFHLIQSTGRSLPVVVITQNPPDSSTSSKKHAEWEYDMTTFTINGTRFAKVAGLYCHVYMIDHAWNHKFAEAFSIDRNDVHGCIAIFWPLAWQKENKLYTKQMVKYAQFDFNRFAFHEETICEKAFRHKLVQLIKDEHVAYL